MPELIYELQPRWMRFFQMFFLDVLIQLFPEFSPDAAKVHLASFNGKDAPIDVYLAGDFPEWQCKQNARNFERKFVVALIELPQRHEWLFAGLWRSEGSSPRVEGGWHYNLSEVKDCSELNGRVVVGFQ